MVGGSRQNIPQRCGLSDWGLAALKGPTVRSGTSESGVFWKEDVLHGKEFRFYPSGSGEGLHGQVCILLESPQLLCRDWPGGDRGAHGAAIWEAARSSCGEK